jgi:UDP-MurNAc hydroxylase
MKVTLVADSTFLFEHRGKRLLTDPWIGTTIYGGAWQQFPPPVVAHEEVGPLDYIFISHIHEDHCDPQTIRHLDRQATVIVMERTPNLVASFLERQEFRFASILRLSPFRPHRLTDDWTVEIVDADPGHILNHFIDSSLLLHWQGGTIYFANDNPPYPKSLDHLRRYRHRLAILPASGGSGYPACFQNLSPEEKTAERQRIVRAYLTNFVNTIDALTPQWFMASAGNHILSGRLAPLTEVMTFLWSPMIAYRFAHERLAKQSLAQCRPLHLAEGESFDLDGAAPTEVEAIWRAASDEGDWLDRKRAFIAAAALHGPYEYERHRLPADLPWREIFCAAAANMLSATQRAGIDFRSRIYVRIPEGERSIWGHVDGETRSTGIDPTDSPKREPYLAVACDARLLHLLLTGEFSWNIADASAFLEYDRRPNIYDQAAVIALNYLRLPRSSGQPAHGGALHGKEAPR